ncbi:MAG: hypothetical protein LBP60_04990 [Spirochaetaceae bacterium]|jgi:hypothetical protein|nr:hypothetical protein [Spirochaetaceae bacterium]
MRPLTERRSRQEYWKQNRPAYRETSAQALLALDGKDGPSFAASWTGVIRWIWQSRYRPHQGLHGIPNAPPGNPSACGDIKKKPLVFGLHNHYYREAA